MKNTLTAFAGPLGPGPTTDHSSVPKRERPHQEQVQLFRRRSLKLLILEHLIRRLRKASHTHLRSFGVFWGFEQPAPCRLSICGHGCCHVETTSGEALPSQPHVQTHAAASSTGVLCQTALCPEMYIPLTQKKKKVMSPKNLDCSILSAGCLGEQLV